MSKLNSAPDAVRQTNSIDNPNDRPLMVCDECHQNELDVVFNRADWAHDQLCDACGFKNQQASLEHERNCFRLIYGS